LIRRLFTGEAALLSLAGSVLGIGGALLFGVVMMAGLRTWWVGAVGTTALSLHVSVLSLIIGAVGGIVAALVCIWWTLRRLGQISERSLLSGQLTGEGGVEGRPWSRGALAGGATVLLVVGAGLVATSGAGMVNRTIGFFSAGSLLLLSALCWLAF